jgi:hypothetical protein
VAVAVLMTPALAETIINETTSKEPADRNRLEDVMAQLDGKVILKIGPNLLTCQVGTRILPADLFFILDSTEVSGKIHCGVVGE